jgi:hypothetical protein
MRWKLFFLLCTICFAKEISAQGRFDRWVNPVIDSSYIDSYYKDLILRIYWSQKYSTQTIGDSGENLKLSYRPSNGYALGAGFTYKFVTINLGWIFPFAKPDPDRYGGSERLDLQAHLYLRRFYVDFFTGYYKGQYLTNTNDLLPDFYPVGQYYVRRDLRTYSLGMGVYTNFNPGKFRFEAPFIQNMKQKKSAGAPTAGFEAYRVGSQADSSFVPKDLAGNSFFDGKDFYRWEILTFNITAGYAYNFVVLKDFFVFLSLNGSIGLGYNHLYLINSDTANRISSNKGISSRFGIGYQKDRLFIGASWISYQLFSPTAIPGTYIQWNPGVLRFNIAYRIVLKKGLDVRANKRKT